MRTKFRVGVAGDDVWEYLDGNTWRPIPADIIHWGETAPGGRATLFRIGTDGALTCFWPPQSGN